MKKLEDKIWQFGLLSPEEQVAVELQVQQDADMAIVLEEVKILYQLLKESQLIDDTQSDLAIAYYIAHKSFASAGAPAKMAVAYEQLEQQVREDEDVHKRYKLIQARLEEIASYSDPVTQFEELTGHNIHDIPVADKRKMIFDRKDRGPIVREPGFRQNKWVSSAALVVAIGFLGILLGNNRLERLAYLEAETVVLLSPSEFRGSAEVARVFEPEMIQQQALLKEGVLEFLNAQDSWMNVYYTYDRESLFRAEQVIISLKKTLDQQSDLVDGWLLNETSFVLAKIYLAQHRLEEAKGLLEEVEHHPGDLYNKARQLLDRL